MVPTGVFQPTPESTLRQLREFIVDQVTAFQPDVVIVTERKGTAIYRAVLESLAGEGESGIPSWGHVLASSALGAVPTEYLAGARLLVIDDMVRKGKSLRRVLEQLWTLGVTDETRSNIHVAAFAMHEDAGRGYEFRDTHFPDAVWVQHLPTEAFRQTRARLVRALQRAGSLMLDTEHVEVRLRLRVPLARLAEALARTGDIVVFNSSEGRKNITVFYDAPLSASEVEALPPGTEVTGVVRKCRVVERQPGEYALIPICLPDTPCSFREGWEPAPEDAFLLGEINDLDDEGRFHAVALRASLDPLFAALRDISASREQLCEVHLPSIGDGSEVLSDTGYDLRHLGVVYPTLDLGMFHNRLRHLWRDADTIGKRLRARKWSPHPIGSPTSDELESAALGLLKGIERVADQRAANHAEADGDAPHGQQGATMPEVMELGRDLGLPRVIVSACMDVLIDEAMLVTKVERVRRGLEQLVCRTYLPDGEVASDLVRDHTRRYGLRQRINGYWN